MNHAQGSIGSFILSDKQAKLDLFTKLYFLIKQVMTRIWMFFGIIGLVACGQSEKSPEVSSSSIDIQQKGNQKEEYGQEEFAAVRLQIGQLADQTFSSDRDFSQTFDCYLVTESGDKTAVSDSTAIARYLQLINQNPEPITEAPIFEVKVSQRVVLLVIENKAWAQILLDKLSMQILDIKFPPGSAVAKLGKNAEKFTEQLTGAAVSFSPNNFELAPWDEQIPPKGEVVVDGISGATKICQVSLDMLNHQLPFYQQYLQGTPQ